MEIVKGPGQRELFYRRHPILRAVLDFSRSLPNRINPLWYVFWIFHMHGRRRSLANMEKALAMSYVVNGFTSEEKVRMTVVKDGVTITPQQSFVDFFRDRDLSSVNPDKFVCEFIDLYSRNEGDWMADIRGAEEVTLEMVNGLWERFGVLVAKEKGGAEDLDSLKMRWSIGRVSFFQRIRRWVRVLLSGTGRVN